MKYWRVRYNPRYDDHMLQEWIIYSDGRHALIGVRHYIDWSRDLQFVSL